MNTFGWELVMNLYGCDPKTIRSGTELRKFVKELCKVIHMKTYGPTIVKHFGYGKAYTKGFSLVQLIETSAITGHFSELWNKAYINVFSCKRFNYEKALNFTQKFFKCRGIEYTKLTR